MIKKLHTTFKISSGKGKNEAIIRAMVAENNRLSVNPGHKRNHRIERDDGDYMGFPNIFDFTGGCNPELVNNIGNCFKQAAALAKKEKF